VSHYITLALGSQVAKLMTGNSQEVDEHEALQAENFQSIP
jgi:hypothetical protein